MNKVSRLPIGIFDSGVGGLTVLKAVRERLGAESLIYLGDTARVPYGTKSKETVTHYAHQIAAHLLQEKIKLLVVACNTATALALSSLQTSFPDLPCLGVVEPGAQAAAKTSRTGQIVVLSTEGTKRSGAYHAAIKKHRPEAEVHSLGCNLLVGMVEEGWCEGPEAEAVVNRYIRQLQGIPFDTLVLGCTHFPLLAPTIHKGLPPDVTIVDSATTTALAVCDFLKSKNLLNTTAPQGRNQFFVTDAPDRFQRLAAGFLPDTDVGTVELVNLIPTP